MFYDQIIRRVRNTAGDINVLQFTEEMLVDWINDAVRECAIENNLLQKIATQNTVANQQEYDLPTDIMKLHSIYINGEKLKILTLQEWEEVSGGQPTGVPTTGAPYQVYIWATKLNVWPPPSSVVPIKINYIYSPTDWDGADGDTEKPPLPENYHLRLIPYVLAQVALQDENMVLYEKHMGQFRSGVVDLAQQSQQEEDLYPFISVSSRDMGDYPALEY